MVRVFENEEFGQVRAFVENGEVFLWLRCIQGVKIC